MICRRDLGLTMLVSLFAVVGCGDASTTSYGAQDSLEAATLYGACADENVDLAPPLEFLLNARHWDRVSSVDGLDLDRSEAVTDRESSSEIKYTIERAVERGSTVRLRTHESFMPGMDWALVNKAELYVAYGYEPAEDDVLATALVIPNDADPFFIGSCAHRGMTTPLLRSLGSDYRTFLTAMMETPIEERGKVVDSYLGEPESDVGLVLNPESAPTELLDSLHDYALAVHAASDAISGPGTLCMKIEIGWNDCIDLSQLSETPQLITGYYGEDGVVEVWLMDENADLANPIQMLGTLNMLEVAGPDFGAEAGLAVGVVVDGKLDSKTQGSIAMIQPSVKVTGVAAVDRLLADRALATSIVGAEIVNELTRVSPPIGDDESHGEN